MSFSFEENFKKIGIIFKNNCNISKNSYEQAVLVDKFIYISGQLPIVNGNLKNKGIVGVDVSIEEAYDAAKICAINAIQSIKNIKISIDQIERIVQIQGFVSCKDNFTEQGKVINGASDIILKIFGDEVGKHSRFAIGVSRLPMGSSVEVAMIIKIK